MRRGCGGLERQRNAKSRTTAHRALDVDASAVGPDDALDNAQPQTGTFNPLCVLIGPAKEAIEDARAIAFDDPQPAVLDRHHGLGLGRRERGGNAALLGRELDRVVQQFVTNCRSRCGHPTTDASFN